MVEESRLSKVPMPVTRGFLVVSLQVELYDETMLQIQRDILERVSETGMKGVVIDLTAIEVLDSFLGQALSDTARMVSLLGATTVFVGLKPGVVSSLVDLGLELQELQTAVTLEEGFQRLESLLAPKEETEETEGLEEEAEDEGEIEDLPDETRARETDEDDETVEERLEEDA